MDSAFNPEKGLYERDEFIKFGAVELSEKEFAGYLRLDFEGKRYIFEPGENPKFLVRRRVLDL
jgi:hypothetical protein